MTQWTIKTTLSEADDISKGIKNFCFRSSKMPFRKDDEITFQPMKSGKLTRHPIEKMKFRVLYVSADAPIEKGFSVIGLKRIA